MDKAIRVIENEYLSSAALSIEDISHSVLREAKRLTGSAYGFSGYIDPATGWFVSATLTRDVWSKCGISDKSAVFRKFTGLWGWVLKNKKPLLTNDARADTRSGGTPQGHIKIEKFLAAPAVFNRKLTGVLALANPARDYTERDLAAVKRLARLYAVIIQRKSDEDMLRDSERKYRTLFENANAAIFLADTETGTILDANRGAELLTGRPRHELIGMDRKLLHPPEEEEYYREHFRTHIANGAARLADAVILKKNGDRTPVYITAAVMELGGKKAIMGIFEDAGERKRMEEALSKLTRCFLKFGPSPDANMDIITRTAGEILGAACVLYNRLENGLLCTTSDWRAPADMPRRDAAKGHICFDVISGAKDRIFVARNLHKSAYAKSDPNVRKYGLKTCIGYPVSVDGTAIGSLCAAFRTDREPAPNEIEIMSILAKALGIEEQRRRAESGLKKNEETLRGIFDAAKDGIFIKDPQGRYVKANRFCAGLFGLTPEEMAGRTDYDLFPAETAEKLREQDKTVMEKNKTVVVDNAMEFKTGRKVFNTVKTPLRNGGITGVLGVARDVTRLKELEAELVRAKAVQAVRKIAGPAAHDFNNILAAINGYATLILETADGKNRVRPEIMQIIKAVRRAAAVTEKLHTYGREPDKNSCR